jgi:transposase
LTPQQLFGWRRAAERLAEDGADESGSAFAPVIVEAARPCAEVPIAPGQLSGSPMIEIVIGVATVRFLPGIDAATLTTVLRAVRATT